MESIKVTEQASAYDNLQEMSIHDLLTGINREDHRVADAVAATIPTMERLVEGVVERMRNGGRMFYIGSLPEATVRCAGPWSMRKMTRRVPGATCSPGIRMPEMS